MSRVATDMDGPESGKAAGAPFATVNPYTGVKEREFAFLDAAGIDRAIQNAHRAFVGWRSRPSEERAAIVGRAGELMEQRVDELAALATREVGKLIGDSKQELAVAVHILKWYAERGPRLLEPTRIDGSADEATVVYEPLGVLLAIEPWNFPFYQAIRVAAPSLVLGNTVLLKHAPNNPQTALAIEEVFRDAGAPEGVYTNLFMGIDAVEQVIAHRSVQGVTLTGGEGAGASVGEIAGRHLKKSVLELGGSDPFIVLDAHDLEHTVRAATASRMFNTGQQCTAAKRFIVVDHVYDQFAAGMAEAFRRFSPGDPADPATTLGPVSSERAAQGLEAQVRDAIDKGATVLVGGGRPDHPGAFVDATLLTDVTRDMRVYGEELFGPVGVVYRVRDEDEAVQLANDSDYGLGAAVFGSDLGRAWAVAERIEAGMVSVNTISASSPELPFGGVKRSGYGRELGGCLGMREFANQKLIRADGGG